MAEIVVEETRIVDEPAEPSSGLWGFITYWGLHAWVLAYTVVMLSAFSIQFVMGEFPCPLCMLQRYGMILATLGALFVIMQARRGTLTTARYAQGRKVAELAVEQEMLPNALAQKLFRIRNRLADCIQSRLKES